MTRPTPIPAYSAGDILGGNGGRSGVALTSISIASPGVATLVAHGFVNGDAIELTTTGALPTGLTASTTYFVVNAAADTFQLSATRGGAAINTSGTQSGTHTAHYFAPAVLAMPGMSMGGDLAKLEQALLSFVLTSVPAGMTTFRVHLYAVAPPSGFVDGELWTLPTADLPFYLGYVDLAAPTLNGTGGATISTQGLDLKKWYQTVDTPLYAYLVTVGGYTPAAGTSFTLTMQAVSA